MIIDDLKTLGFSNNVAQIYLLLIQSKGSARAGEIIKETALQRSVVYSALSELVERGLVSERKRKGVSEFSANDSHSLVDEVEKKRKVAEEIAESLEKQRAVKSRESAVYEGDDIVKRIAEKSLSAKNATIYFLGPSKFGVQSGLEKFWARYHNKRIEKGLSCKILYDRKTDENIVKSRNTLAMCEAKYLPFGLELPLWFTIWDDYVALVVPSEEPPLAFLIRSKKSAEAMVEYFEYLWSQKI